MKRVRINTGKVGLVFKNGNYHEVLTQGVYWLSYNESVMLFDRTQPFQAPIELNILLKDPELVAMLTLVEVKDHELVLAFANDNFQRVLTPGRYAYWKGLIDYTFIKADLRKVEITEPMAPHILTRKEMAPYVHTIAIASYEKGLLYIDGKFAWVLDTGVYYFWKNTTQINVLKADLRLQQMEVSGQEMLTKDKAALRINFYAHYQVVDMMKALAQHKDYAQQLYVLMQLALREFVGTLTLDELLEKKEAIANYVQVSLREKADALGLNIHHAGVRDIILPGEVKEIMNQVLIAQKKAEANVIMRREETASTRSLLNTAKLMEENAMLFKLKEMEYVEKIADKISSISLSSGGSHLVDQLKGIFVPAK